MKWKSVQEELPNANHKVLAYSEGGDRVYLAFREPDYEYNEHWTICDDCSCVGCTAPINFWMEIPSRPERVKRSDTET